jgi:hypothetical protein
MTTINEDTKICTTCKEVKKVTEFHKHKNCKGGCRNQCKLCIRQYNRNKVVSGESKLYQKKKSKQDSINGQCASCSQKRLPTSKLCMKHFVYHIINFWKIPKEEKEKLISALINKFEYSEGSCFYTGLKLIPGFNASIDHRIPQAKGGKHVIENLEWVHKCINFMKNDLSEKEFINRSANILVELNSLASKEGII